MQGKIPDLQRTGAKLSGHASDQTKQSPSSYKTLSVDFNVERVIKVCASHRQFLLATDMHSKVANTDVLLLQVETESAQLNANMAIHLTVQPGTSDSSSSWCSDNVHAVKMVNNAWQSMEAGVDCSKWPEYVIVHTNSPGTYGYYVSSSQIY